MQLQPLFATWGADWDLLGPMVWFFLALGSVTAWFASRWSPLAVSSRQRLLSWLPMVMLFGCLFTRWVRMASASFLGHEYFRKVYYAHLDLALIVCLAFGVASTLGTLRIPERYSRLAGYLYVPAYLLLLSAVLGGIRGWHDF